METEVEGLDWEAIMQDVEDFHIKPPQPGEFTLKMLIAKNKEGGNEMTYKQAEGFARKMEHMGKWKRVAIRLDPDTGRQVKAYRRLEE